MGVASQLAASYASTPWRIRTRSGIEFDASGDVWAYREGLIDVSVDFGTLAGISPELLMGAKRTLAWYVEHRSADHVMNLHTRLLHFVRSTVSESGKLESITSVALINYKAKLESSNEWYLGTFAGLLRKWDRLGYTGVSKDALQFLNGIKVKGNAKGVAVLTMDPRNGPFTHIEAEALQDAMNDAYATGIIDAADFMLAWLYVLLGQRNMQYAALKVCDVVLRYDAGIPVYSVKMPSAKRRGVRSRDRLVERKLIEQFGEMLFAYKGRVREQFFGKLDDPDQAPLFPGTARENGDPDFRFHRTADQIGARLTRVLEGLSVASERTGEEMNVTARRFRSTIGTRAGEEGYPPLVIAALLDHTDTQSVGVYTANSPAIIDRIDRALAMDMAPLAQAFAGVIQDSVEAAASDPSRRIIDLRIDRSGAAMGSCGSHGFCGFAAPIACYTCKSFNAWLDGPHEAVLQRLLDRRERLLCTSDKRMASVNDRTIFAVASVVKQCNDIKSVVKVSIGG